MKRMLLVVLAVLAVGLSTPAVMAQCNATPPVVTPASPQVCPLSTGNTATGTGNNGSSFQWAITNGTITAGATTGTVTYTAGATGSVTLSLTVTQGNCARTTTVTIPIIDPNSAPTVTAGGPTSFCVGGSVTLTSSSATLNQWYRNGVAIGGATAQTFSATTSGNYTVVVSNGSCSSQASAPVAVTASPVPPTPAITPGGPTTFCAGGSVTLSSNAASGNQWFLNGTAINGATGTTFNATTSGNYTVVTTNAGCASAPSPAVTVTANPIPSTPTINAGGPTTFCAGGSVTLSSSSASGNQWFLNGTAINGATNQTYAAADAGDYTVVVTTSGCSSAPSAATTVSITPLPPTPSVSAGGATTFCQGGSVTLTSDSATGNQWYLNGSPIGGATDQTYSANASGDYTVVVTSNGCPSAPSAPATVTVNPTPATPNVTAGSPTTFCAGGSVTLTSDAADGNQWYADGSPLNGANGPSLIVTQSGSYTVVVTSLGCSSAASSAVVVTVNPIPATPSASPDGPTTFCQGGSVTLTSTSASGNQWYLDGSPIGGATDQTYSANASGDYTVVVTSLGCSSAASAAVTVTVNPIPAAATITPGGPTTFCAGGSVTLTSDSAAGNQWYLNGSPIANATDQTYNATDAGDYTVVVTALSCPSAPSAPVSVTVNPIPATPTVTPGSSTTFCAGGSVTLTSSSASGNQWYVDGSPINGATDSSLVVTDSGSYTVVVTELGCSSASSSAVVVTVNPIPATPTINAGGPTTFCAGGSVTLTSSSASGNQWYFNGNPIANAADQTYEASQAGDYTVVVTSLGCSSAASAAVTVTINPTPATPTVNAGGATTFCTGGSVTLTSSSASGNQWYLNGSPINNATDQTYIASDSGDYTVVVTDLGCASAASAPTTVTVNAIPATPSITPNGPTVFCEGGSVVLSSSSASGNQWYLDGSPIASATGSTYTAAQAGSYTVIVSIAGCTSATSSAVNVSVNPIPATPSVNAGGATSFCEGGSVTLTSTSASGNQWYADGNLIAGANGQTYNATQTGSYTVVVTELACSSAPSAPVSVTVTPIPAAPVLGVPQSVAVGATGVTASVADHAGSTYTWTITGGTITGGQGTSTVTYNAGAPGTRMTLSVVETAGPGCASPAASTRQMVDFLDVPPSHPFHNFVIKIAINGITAGCGGGNFCPGDAVSRAQMSVFLLVGKHGDGYIPPQATGFFDDVPVGSFAANFIEELYNEGITGGCSANPPLYCPSDPVTRAQMAVFLEIGKNGAGYVPPTATGIFGDVPVGSFAADFIEQLYRDGITGGCSSNPLLYCPASSTTRGQMSVFLTVTFALP